MPDATIKALRLSDGTYFASVVCKHGKTFEVSENISSQPAYPFHIACWFETDREAYAAAEELRDNLTECSDEWCGARERRANAWSPVPSIYGPRPWWRGER